MDAQRPASAIALVLVGIVVPLWWLALFANDAFRERFVAPADWPALRPFLLPDFGLASLTIACGVQGLRGRLSRLMAGLACGAWGYATLWTVGAMLSATLRAVGVVLMLTALTVVTLCCHALVSKSSARVD